MSFLPCSRLRSLGPAIRSAVKPHALSLAALAVTSRSSSSSSSTPTSAAETATPSPPSAPQTSTPAIPLPDFEARTTFSLPTTVPSWYVGHMQRALRSLPALLARHPPPLVIEARDSRLPLTSINPAFENVMRDTFGEHGWQQRRLVVYTKRDLIDRRLEQPFKEALAEETAGDATGEVFFVDTKNSGDIRQVIKWIDKQAAELSRKPPPKVIRTRQLAKTQRTLSGAFKHTSTPEQGVRLVIVGMPNVGKSSLLNALRRVGAGKGKAVSTAPQPGHTRKLTGTVRITKDKPVEANHFKLNRPESGDGEGNERDNQHRKDEPPPVYVYDTPGVMVPYLGRGEEGAEKGVKLALAAGMKSSLFDTQALADYLLYRLNLKYAWQRHRWLLNQKKQGSHAVDPSAIPQPVYLTRLPMPDTSTKQSPPNEEDIPRPTNSVIELLKWASIKAPGTLLKGGERDLDGCAEFIITKWREGRLGRAVGELDLGVEEGIPSEDAGMRETVHQRVRTVVGEYFASRRRNGMAEDEGEAIAQYAPPEEEDVTDSNGASFAIQDDGVRKRTSKRKSSFREKSTSTSTRASTKKNHSSTSVDPQDLSTNQIRKQAKAQKLKEKRAKLRAKGVLYDDRPSRRLPMSAQMRRSSEIHKNWLIREGKLRIGKAARNALIHGSKKKATKKVTKKKKK